MLKYLLCYADESNSEYELSIISIAQRYTYNICTLYIGIEMYAFIVIKHSRYIYNN